MRKVTPWFPPEIKPVRNGIYKVKDSPRNQHWYRYWDCNNHKWGAAATSPEAASALSKSYWFQESEWRGLARKPK